MKDDRLTIKIQVLLSKEDYENVSTLILHEAGKNKKIISVSNYIRQIIKKHIDNNSKILFDQKSFVEEDVKTIIQKQKEKNG